MSRLATAGSHRAAGAPRVQLARTSRGGRRRAADRLAMSAQEKAAARDAILAAERLSDESSAVRVVRAICVTCLAVGSVTCILVALLGPRTSSMKIPLLSAPPLAQLTLDDSLRKPSSLRRRLRRGTEGPLRRACRLTAAPAIGTRAASIRIANEQARCGARHTTPKLSRTSAYVWMAARRAPPTACSRRPTAARATEAPRTAAAARQRDAEARRRKNGRQKPAKRSVRGRRLCLIIAKFLDPTRRVHFTAGLHTCTLLPPCGGWVSATAAAHPTTTSSPPPLHCAAVWPPPALPPAPRGSPALTTCSEAHAAPRGTRPLFAQLAACFKTGGRPIGRL